MNPYTQTLFQHIDRHLPAYAQPQFLRVAERPSLTSHMTTTFKQIKTQLRQVISTAPGFCRCVLGVFALRAFGPGDCSMARRSVSLAVPA